MDRTRDCGSRNPGSIPGRGTKRYFFVDELNF